MSSLVISQWDRERAGKACFLMFAHSSPVTSHHEIPRHDSASGFEPTAIRERVRAKKNTARHKFREKCLLIRHFNRQVTVTGFKNEKLAKDKQNNFKLTLKRGSFLLQNVLKINTEAIFLAKFV